MPKSPLQLFKPASPKPLHPAFPVPFHRNHNPGSGPQLLPLFLPQRLAFPSVALHSMACPPPLRKCDERSFQQQSPPDLLALLYFRHCINTPYFKRNVEEPAMKIALNPGGTMWISGPAVHSVTDCGNMVGRGLSAPGPMGLPGSLEGANETGVFSLRRLSRHSRHLWLIWKELCHSSLSVKTGMGNAVYWVTAGGLINRSPRVGGGEGEPTFSPTYPALTWAGPSISWPLLICQGVGFIQVSIFALGNFIFYYYLYMPSTVYTTNNS